MQLPCWRRCLPAFFVLTTTLLAQRSVIDYPIVYVRALRYGDTTNTNWPEVFDPIALEPGADLMLRLPDGREEVLFAGGHGAVVDPSPSFDAEWVFFSYFPDVRTASLNYQRRNAPRSGADIYKIHVRTRQVVRLTNQEWSPAEGAANWSSNPLTANPPGTYYLGYGIFNLGPCPLPNGKLMFVSSRDSYLPNKDFTFPNLRLYVMDQDGRNVEKIGHINIGSALHPTVLADGRVMFSSYEGQGQRDSRSWSLWSIFPDGRYWEPLMSSFSEASAWHFQTQLSDRRIAVIEYYNLNNNGFGTLVAFNPRPAPNTAPFGSPVPASASNPPVRRGIWFFNPGHPAHLQPRYKQYPFSPQGLVALSGFTHGEDEASSRALDGSFAGKVTHPSGAPDNDVLLVWTPGPANDLDRPTTMPRYDGGIYLLRAGASLDDHRQLVLLKNDPAYNEMQPRALVPYARIYGIGEPAAIPWLPNDGSSHTMLPAGTPFGIVGTASFYNRDTTPGVGSSRFGGLDPFNTAENSASSNWFTQGSDAGRYSNADIHAVRIVAMEGAAHRSYGPASNVLGFRAHSATERLRILGEIPLRKAGNAVDGDGNPDTSFLARIPADTPFTFQTLDQDGLVLNMAQTWHQVRPGEVRADCGGCHGHSRRATDFASTAAGRGAFPPVDLVNRTPLLTRAAAGAAASVRVLNQRMADVEYYRDIKPILQRSCVQCHSRSGTAAAGLVLDDTTLADGFENTWHRLANDAQARFGTPPVIWSRTWRQTNASRYVRMFQARRSLLMWKIMGRRLDGWTNADHPTESTPGNAATLPPGANPNDADIDFTGSIMPPTNGGVPLLTEDEKLLFARWIDLGCPISSPDAGLSGWLADELKPTLTVSSPRAGDNLKALTEIRIGMYDSYSGLDPASLSVIASFPVNGKAPGVNLGPDFVQSGDHIWTLPLAPPIASLAGARLTVRVRDRKGNSATVDRAFGVASVTPAPQHALTLAASPSAGGVLTANPAAPNRLYDEGTSVQVTAVAAPGFEFRGFGGSLSGSANPQPLIMSGPRSVTAIFAPVVVQDTVPPSTALTAPTASATVRGDAVSLTATASDNIGVTSVQFQLDGAALGPEITRPPFAFTWDSTKTPNGPHTLSAKARDAAGNTGNAPGVRVTVDNPAGPPPPPPGGGPVAAYSFDALGGTQIADDSGSGRTAEGVGVTLGAGRFCRAAVFDRALDSLTVADHALLDPGAAGLTLSFWVRPDSPSGLGRPMQVVDKGANQTGGVAYGISLTGAGQLPEAVIRVNGVEHKVTSASGLALNRWHHLALTYDGTRMRLFVGGLEVAAKAVTGPITETAEPLRIGTRPTFSSPRTVVFLGAVDELRIHRRALTPFELQRDMVTPVSGACVSR